MKTSVRGVPTTIAVDGQEWAVSFDQWGRWSARMNHKAESDYVRVEKYADLPEAIRTWVQNDAAEREYARKERADKKAATESVPQVWALYKGERVAVRGRSQRKKGWRENTDMLITRASGKKESVFEGNLISLSSDQEALKRIDAEVAELNKQLYAVKTAGKLDEITKTLRFANLEIDYDIETAEFTGTYEGFSATADKPKEVETQIQRLAIAAQRPFMVSYSREAGYTIVNTTEADSNFYGYDEAWFNRADAMRYIELSQQIEALAEERKQYREQFNYEDELATVRAALKVVNGEPV